MFFVNLLLSCLKSHLYIESSKLLLVGFHRYILSNLDGDASNDLEQEVNEFDPSSEVSRIASSDEKTLSEY